MAKPLTPSEQETLRALQRRHDAYLRVEQERLAREERAADAKLTDVRLRLDDVTAQLERGDPELALDAQRTATAKAIINAGRKARNEPPLDDDGNVIPFNKDR
jgi:hypothetical protein